MYQLSATLEGHTQDVRDITVFNNNHIGSVSRDGSVRLWNRSTESQNYWENKIIFETDNFLNSISYDSINEIVYFGGKDALINGCKLDALLGQDPLFTLIGHESNVCSLNRNPVNCDLISGSWDKSAKVWSNGELKYTLKGHEASVWDSQFFPNSTDRFITVSADKSIRIWDKGICTKVLSNIHNDVIRKVAFVPDETKEPLIATCSNDTTIKISTLNGKIDKIFEGHESFVYSIKINERTSELVSCGEDRSLRVWDYSTGEIKQVIRLPSISIWCVEVLPNDDIIVGCSDNTIRIFTKETKRLASSEEVAEFDKEVQGSTLNSQTMGFDESKLSPPDVLKKPGNKEGQIVVVKAPNGALEAHQFSSGQWDKVGEVVGSSGTGSDKKVKFEDKQYDFVFDVDMEEGKPPLKLPVNTSDNPYDVADKFILRNELPSSYRDQIVNFIIKNTSGISLDQTSSGEQQETKVEAAQSTGTQPLDNLKVLPVREYLSISSFNPDSIFSGIVKLNENEKTFGDNDIATIGSALNDLENNSDRLYNYACTIRSSWANKMPAYDILRLIVHMLPVADDISEFIEEGLGSKNINTTMLTVRILANCFLNKQWGTQLMSSDKVYNSIFETIDTLYDTATQRQAQNLAVSVATLILNYSVLLVNEPSTKLDIVPVIAEAINNKYGVLEEYQDSEEAAYRLVVAYGNLSMVEPSLKQFSKSIVWLKQVNSKYGNTITRFNDIFNDLY